MSLLTEVVDAADPALAVHAVAEPGPGRFEGLDATPERRFVLEAVREGYLMHYGEPRAYAGMEEDLRLLAGDALYALGLSRLAEAGDLEAVAELVGPDLGLGAGARREPPGGRRGALGAERRATCAIGSPTHLQPLR